MTVFLLLQLQFNQLVVRFDDQQVFKKLALCQVFHQDIIQF